MDTASFAADAGLRLRPVATFPGRRALLWDGDVLYASSGYSVERWRPGSEWEPVAAFVPTRWRRATARWRLTERLFRDGFHALAALRGGRLVGVVAGGIVVAEPGSKDFRMTFGVERGTRPLALAVSGKGEVFWGEYFSNPRREAVHVYGSSDRGETWRIVHTFPAGTIRHVHGIQYDPFDDCLWVLTGDEDHESQILRASLDWRSVERVAWGRQQTRAVTIQPTREALYFASDTPSERNWIYRMDRSGSVRELAPICGSCFWGAQAAGRLFFTTAVEPSPVNRSPVSRLYGGSEADGWCELLAWERDRLPARLFQYANILLPSGESRSGLLAATGLAVRGHDGVTYVWQVGAP